MLESVKVRYRREARPSGGNASTFSEIEMKRAKVQDGSKERLDELHAKLWSSRSEGSICFRMCIWGNFFNLFILPKLERDFDILRDDFNILLCLAAAGKLTGTEICRIVGRPRNSISRCAERLVRRKLIQTKSVAGDRRQTIFEILPEGRKLYRAMLPHMLTLEEKMLAALDENERTVLDGLLTKLSGEFGAIEPIE